MLGPFRMADSLGHQKGEMLGSSLLSITTLLQPWALVVPEPPARPAPATTQTASAAVLIAAAVAPDARVLRAQASVS